MKTKFNGILTLLLAFMVQLTFAQSKTISGNVTDETGPLPGVSVLIKGTNTGTETDFDGNYSIEASVGDVLQFSFIGMTSQEITVGASNSINVTLEADSVLEEVVVVGYSTYKRSEVTGSAVQLTAEELTDVVTPSIDQALQGKVAGLSVSANSGTPGSTSQIRIRGISSITAGNEPLYVIDGVPISNGNASNSGATSFFSNLASIDPNNIASVTVLKDASATAQYGARGSNGVILITTKTGKSGKTQFNFNSQYGFSNDAVDGPDPLTTVNRLELASEAYFNDGFFGTEAEAEAYLLAREPYLSWDANGRPEGNWKETIKNNDAVTQQYGFNATGGQENYNFNVGLGYMQQEGTVIGSEFERISGNLTFSVDLTDNLTFSTSNEGSFQEQDAFLERSAYFEGARSSIFFMPPYRIPYNDDGSINQFGGSLPNPLYITKYNIDDNTLSRIRSINKINWDLGNGFDFMSRFGIDYQVYNSRSYSNRNYGYGSPTSGDAGQYVRHTTDLTFQNQLNYRTDIGEDHNLTAFVLQEYQSNKRYYLGGYGENFADDGLFNLDSTGNPVSITSNETDYYLGAYALNASFSAYGGKFILNGNYRYEGNSRFSPDERWGGFWSVGGAWNVHKMNFLNDSNWINNLKLRASYGVTGNANIGLNQYQSLFSYSVDYNGEGAQLVNTFGNDALTWEKSNTLDVGIEYTLFDGIVNGNFTYFNRQSYDLLLNVPLSQTTGFTSQVQNIGELTNKGIEAEINVNIVRSEDFNFSLGGNMGTVDNEITKLPLKPDGEERTITSSRTRIESGHPVNAWYMPTWAGVNPDTGEEMWYIDEVGGETTTVFNDAEQVFQGGNGVPTFTAGMNMHVDFKNFYLDANGYYATGHKVRDGWHRYTSEPNAYPIFAFQGLTTLLDRWQEPGDVTRHGKFSSSFTPWQSHSKYLFDGTYFRLRSVTLGYDFTDKLNVAGIAGLNVFLRGQNLATWTKDSNLTYDPEIDLGGTIGLETPPSKTILFGLNIKF
ncbi:SusC/RagA family TonB-linked outer membrane protein [Urechidicola vernalis]|uniref:TonB-dependent receptor n=1 Tax=Urechidicola vernalis TaxID=3075600 RepID=A0ABU2Y341_9FLAO|nr:TonB-dependent receptor [Urechidicola sp. P050]MDT0552586.1 TonB-dependent receptor [Urechidicola sp. P050]